jgi:SAM-dependent methyltransferase
MVGAAESALQTIDWAKPDRSLWSAPPSRRLSIGPLATITVAAELEGTLEDFLAELTAALAARGLAFDGDRLVENGFDVGRVTARSENRLVLEWHEADWDDNVTSEVELRHDGSALVLEHRGFGGSFWDAAEVAGWFADQVAAPTLAATAPERLGEWLTDRAARRPSGAAQRAGYRDPSHHRPSFGAILEELRLGPDDVLLEIGCGGGAFLEHALRSGCRAKAVDHSAEMVRVARELNATAIEEGRLEIVQASADRLPFADGSCTCAAMMQVFFFLDPKPVLTECRRVVRDGGILAVFTVSEAAKGTPAAPEPMASRGRFYTDDQLVGLARAAGFDHAIVKHPDLEPHARAAGLPDDIVQLFVGGGAASQLLVAR